MTSTTTSVLGARFAAALGLGLATLAAGAQTPGTYTGQNAQGNLMQVVLTEAPGGAGLEVTTIRASYLLGCERSTTTPVSLSSVVNGYFPVNDNGAFAASYRWDRDEFQTTGQFAADGTVAGTTYWALAAVTRLAPHLAELCRSPDLPWTGSLGAAAVQALPGRAGPSDFTIERTLDRDGKVLSETLRRTR